MFTCMLSWAQSKQFIPPEILAKPAPPFTHRDLPAKFIVFLSDDYISVSQTTWLSIFHVATLSTHSYHLRLAYSCKY